MADDLTIVDQDGKVYSYPKPVTVNQRMMRDSGRISGVSGAFSRKVDNACYTHVLLAVLGCG